MKVKIIFLFNISHLRRERTIIVLLAVSGIQSLLGNVHQLILHETVDETAGLRGENSLQHLGDVVLGKHPIGRSSPASQLGHLRSLLGRHPVQSPPLGLHHLLGGLRESFSSLQGLQVEGEARGDHLTSPGGEIVLQEPLELSVCE